MASRIDSKLKELGIELPEGVAPAANYVPYVITGNLVVISGQICKWQGEMKYKGKLGKDLSVEQGKDAAKICMLNVLSQLKHACGGNLDKVARCVRLGIFVNCTDSFTEQPGVGNGASDLVVEIFGDKGRHARAAIGCNSLPLDTAVEVEAIFELN